MVIGELQHRRGFNLSQTKIAIHLQAMNDRHEHILW